MKYIEQREKREMTKWGCKQGLYYARFVSSEQKLTFIPEGR